jgi:hypothetical protein
MGQALQGPMVMVVTFIVGMMFLVLWNKMRTRGKMWCLFVRKDKSLVPSLCRLASDFVIYKDRAYDVYPDYVRVARYPSGWPWFMQELVPASLYDEEDAVPLDWINIDKRLERSMQLRAALEENWVKKLVQESATEGKSGINWKKLFPILLIAAGVIGLLFLLSRGGCSSGTPKALLPLLFGRMM